MSKLKVYMTEIKNQSFAKAIRAKCLDCVGDNTAAVRDFGDNTAAVRDCHICKCPLWAYRFGKGTSTAIESLSKSYDVVLVDIDKVDYVEEVKGKHLRRPPKVS